MSNDTDEATTVELLREIRDALKKPRLEDRLALSGVETAAAHDRPTANKVRRER